jgi:hypothetical protein
VAGKKCGYLPPKVFDVGVHGIFMRDMPFLLLSEYPKVKIR